MIMLFWLYVAVCIGGTYQQGEDPSISETELNEAFKENEDVAQQRRALEERLVEEGEVVKPSETDISLIRNRMTDPYIHMLESKQLIFEAVSDTLIQRHNLNSSDSKDKLPQKPRKGDLYSQAKDECEENISVGQCDKKSRYRTANGTCNNLKHPEWGMAGVCFRRLVPPKYVGQSDFRESVNGDPLPQPRTLSLNIHYDLNRPTNYVTHMYAFFGQLLDHDISQSPDSITVDNEAIQCCSQTENTHPQCAPILISTNDPFYSQFGTTCLNFVRSAICPTCTLGYRQQINQITAYIDASFVYGNSENETRTLRTLDGTGKLRSEKTSFGELLPSSPDPENDGCSFPDTNDICFQAGDARVNENPVLTSLQTVFMREHNRIATELHKINTNWDDERLFQETRKIVGAEMQVIVYKEYLPITLGNDRMRYFKLYVGTTTLYKNDQDASLYNEFSTAAFRFRHSLINSVIARRPLNSTNGLRYLRDAYFQPFDLRRGIAGPLLRGVTNSPAQSFDQHLVADVTNYLYRIRGDPAGLDLASINIQRGRDHGLPTYVDMVSYCSGGNIKIRNFNDLVRYRLMEQMQAQGLQQNYRNVDDIDLWTGCLNEISLNGAIVGPTGACIIGVQFNHLKFGDRFYFEHGNQAGSFTRRQMQELNQVSLSKIICLNSDAQTLPANAMLFNSRNNPIIKCNVTSGPDLSYWKE